MRISPLPLAAVLTLGLLPAAAAAETWKNAPLVDSHCVAKVKANPDAHERSCAIQCASGGYGILTAEGDYLKFDEAGSAKALEALKASEKKDTLRADVTGTRDGSTLKVESIALLP
jgi:hypothetical protein